jgi:hypothetical protein
MRANADLHSPPATDFVNLLLKRLSRPDAELFLSKCDRTRMETGETLGRRGSAPICFPQTAILSIADASGLEVGLVGCEGMTGWTVALSGFHHPLQGSVVLGGEILTLTAESLFEICTASPAIRSAVMCFSVTITAQMASTIMSTARGKVGARLTRRLLMIHDRSRCDRLPLTHDQLASSLGLRRASVTDCLHCLEGDLILRCRRNSIEIRDRRALEQSAGSTYGAAERLYRSLIGPFGIHSR